MISLELAKKRPSNYKGGPVNKYGYRLIYIPLKERGYHTCKKDGYMLEHRYIVECFIGRKLEKSEVVHHKDGNKLNNVIENLEVMTIKTHMQYESKIRPINWDAIEAMRRAKISKKKMICLVEGCNNLVITKHLCNKHTHFKRRGLLFVIGGNVIKVQHKRNKPKISIAKCQQCGQSYQYDHKKGKYCELCRAPYQFIKRHRNKLKEMKKHAVS